MKNNSAILRKAIEYIALCPLGEYFIVESDGYYIQFTTCDRQDEIYIEAVSEQFMPQVAGSKPKFTKLGYTLPRQDVESYNYRKTVELNDKTNADSLVAEFKHIFEDIYGVSFENAIISLNGKVIDNDAKLEYKPKPFFGDTNDNDSDNKIGFNRIVIYVVIAVLICGLLYFYFQG